MADVIYMNERKTLLASLTGLMSYRRPDGSQTEQAFIRRYIRSLGAKADGYGNHWLQIGETPRVAWSCHTDTCHDTTGAQLVTIDAAGIMSLANPRPAKSTGKRITSQHSNCLGADDGAGVWLMLEMIRYKMPGLYLFHRAEEHGCIGSRYIAKHSPSLLEGIEACVAFDRKGTQDIITHQVSGRTASDAFAWSLAQTLKMAHRPDDGGIYTDTDSYAHFIPECSNVSVGYQRNHGPGETLDTDYLLALRDAVLAADFRKLQIDRDPYEDINDYGRDDYGVYAGGSTYNTGGWPNLGDDESADIHGDSEYSQLYELVQEHPDLAAEMLRDIGVSASDFCDAVWERTGVLPSTVSKRLGKRR